MTLPDALSLTVAITLSALAMTLIVGVRYLATSGLFAWITARVRPGLYDGQSPQIRREIGWSLASAAIYGVPAGVVAWGWQNRGWTQIYTGWHDYPLWYALLAPLLYLFVHDTWFYWTHRYMHASRAFRRQPSPPPDRPIAYPDGRSGGGEGRNRKPALRLGHAVHHASRPPTAWAAMSFHPLEALSGAIVIPALVFLIPIHVAMLGIVLTIMTVMGITNHMGWEMLPRGVIDGKAGQWLITASHHERHHREYRCNYGLYFRIWDRLCGTDRDPVTFDERPVVR